MANLLDSIVKGYTTGMNNQLNAQKAYIDAYITGINARNAVNQEARTKDQYWNYTNPLQASNLSVIIPQNQTQADFYGDPNVRRQQLAIANQVLGNQYGMSQTEGSLLPTYQRIRENEVNTSDQNAIYNFDQSKANRAMQADNNATAAYKAKASLGMAQDINNLRSTQIQQELNAINNSNPTGTTTDGTTNTDVPTTIMLQNGGKTPTGMFGTDGRLNFTGTTTTPASGLPSNPSNAQQTGQQQVPTGYENKYQHDERIRKENILKSVDTYQKLLDLAIQNGRKDDIAKYSGLLQATKNSLNNPLSNLYDRIFNNQSEADYNYQLNQRKLLGQ